MRKIAIIGLSGLFMLSIVFTGCDSVKMQIIHKKVQELELLPEELSELY